MKYILEKLAYSLKSEYVNVFIIPKLGGKVARIITNDGFEPVFSKKEYSFPEDYVFSKYDTSGIDDCFPTIDHCIVNEISLPDHGEVWANEMEVVEYGKDFIELAYSLKTLPLKFRKKISVIDYEIMFEYDVESYEDNIPFMWAFHGLMNYKDSCRILTDLSKIIKVDGEEMPDDFRELKEYDQNKYYKFYFDQKLNDGNISIEYDKYFLHYSFDCERLKYMGVWITTGGFKGESNIAIEPCSGYYDSLKRSIDNNKYELISKGEHRKWWVKLTLERKRHV